MQILKSGSIGRLKGLSVAVTAGESPSVRFEVDGTGRRELTMHVRVSDDAGVRGAGQIPLVYAPASDDLDITMLEVRKADGRTITGGPEAVQDHAIQPGADTPAFVDLRQKTVTVPALEPGDLITTGTPPGVGMGRTPKRFLKKGDFLRLGIAGLGEQQQAPGRRRRDPGHRLFGKVDMDRIALIGHSRGGEAVAIAADVSERHLANLEYGTGNASILVLLQVAQALLDELQQGLMKRLFCALNPPIHFSTPVVYVTQRSFY